MWIDNKTFLYSWEKPLTGKVEPKISQQIEATWRETDYPGQNKTKKEKTNQKNPKTNKNLQPKTPEAPQYKKKKKKNFNQKNYY